MNDETNEVKILVQEFVKNTLIILGDFSSIYSEVMYHTEELQQLALSLNHIERDELIEITIIRKMEKGIF